MQSEVLPASDLNSTAPSNLNGLWPPSILRLVLGAILTAGLGYIVIKTLFPIFVVPLDIATFPNQSPVWMYERLDNATYFVDGKNYSLVFGVIGAIFGASCVVFSFGARSVKAIVIAVVAAAALGIAGANLSNWMFNHMRVNSGNEVRIMGIALDSMKQSILGYSLLWGLMGLGVGLGIGSIRGFRKSLVAGISGLVGGVLGSMIYVILTAQLSIGTLMNTVLPHHNNSQAIWMVMFTVVIAVCIALGCGEKRSGEKRAGKAA